ncbi:MAG TPA: hypothetical protein VF377_06850 [Acidimicrobiia bacterium]
MLENFSLKEFTWKREPILWLALILAIGQVVYQALGGAIGVEEAVQAIITLIFGFLGRGQVSPVDD